MVTIPLRYSSPKLQPLLQPHKPEKTFLGQIPYQPLLIYLLEGHHGLIPPSETSTPILVKMEKAEEQDVTKDSSYPPTYDGEASHPKIKQRKCVDGDCTAPSACKFHSKPQGRQFRRLEQ